MLDDLSGPVESLNGLPLYIPILIGVLTVLCAASAWWFAPALRRRITDWRVRRRIRRLGQRLISNVQIPDGVDGVIHIDHLVLKDDRIIVVDVKHFDGLIYGGEELHEWTQVVNRKNFHFENPLRQMQLRIQAVKSVIPGTGVEGAVLFAGNGRFPKRVPDGVLTLEDIPRRAQKTEISEQMSAAWNQLRGYRTSTRVR